MEKAHFQPTTSKLKTFHLNLSGFFFCCRFFQLRQRATGNVKNDAFDVCILFIERESLLLRYGSFKHYVGFDGLTHAIVLLFINAKKRIALCPHKKRISKM